MRQVPSLLQSDKKSPSSWEGSAISRHGIIRWGLLIALPLVGVALLVECSLLRGVFATLGPWVILGVATLIASKVKNT